MSGGDPFFRLPTELCCAILRDWLFLDSVVDFDSAVCSAEKRSLLRNFIFPSSQCVLSPGPSCIFHEVNPLNWRPLFEWLNLRQLRVSKLRITWNMDGKVCKYIKTFGGSLKALEIRNSDAAFYLPLISSHCTKIVYLSFQDAKHLILNSDIEFLSSNLKALNLSDTLITDDILEEIVKRCSQVTHILINCCARLSDNCGTIIGSNLKHLLRLDIANTNLSDIALLAIAELSSNTLEIFHAEYCFKMEGYGMNVLLAKCAKLWSLHITYSEDWFIDFDFSLLQNLTELSIINNNTTEAYVYSILSHCKKVERLMLDFDDYDDRPPTPERFQVSESTVENLPALKVLAPLGVEFALFREMRPDVKIVFSFDEFDPPLLSLNW